MKSKLIKKTVFLLIAITLVIPLQLNLLPNGISFSRRMYALNKLKNRTTLPQELDFDTQVTLEALLQPGDDHQRWSANSAARLEGFVLAVRDGSIESANCYSLFRRDTHIRIGLSQNALPQQCVEVEVTPRMRSWANQQGWDWSTEGLAKRLVGHWCLLEGWMLFDTGHDEEAENTRPGRVENWRATAWEIHPITSIEVIR
jgi:hypothetical protein